MKNVNYNAEAACQSENFLLPRYLWKILNYSLVELMVMSLSVGENVNRWGRERQSPVTITPIASRENAMR